MQQMREQYSPPACLSREPTQWTKTISLGTFAVDLDLARRRPGCRRQPLELEAVDDVRIAAIAELGFLAGVERVKAGGDDDGADLDINDLVAHVVADGLWLAGHHALAALEQTAQLRQRSASATACSSGKPSSTSPKSDTAALWRQLGHGGSGLLARPAQVYSSSGTTGQAGLGRARSSPCK